MQRVSMAASCDQLIVTVKEHNPDPFVAARLLRIEANRYAAACQPDLANRCFMAAISLESDFSFKEARSRRPAND